VLLTNRDAFAVVPLKPLRMIQASIITPAMKPESRVMRDFKNCLREEARLAEKKLSQLYRNTTGKKAKAVRTASRS